ncbi:thioesterase family protein [Rhodococcus hoagii]|nr:thioesterase family protein [Prescottella equi]
MTQIVAPTHPFDVAVELSPELGAPGVSWATPPRVREHGGSVRWHHRRDPAARGPATSRTSGDPLSLTMNFAGPIADGAFEVSARPSGRIDPRSTGNIELAQDGVVTTTATAVFGNRRYVGVHRDRGAPAPPPTTWPAAGFPTSSRGTQLRDAVRRRRDPHSRSGRTRIRRPQCGCATPRREPGLSGTDIAVRRLLPARVPASGSYLPAGTVSLTVYFHADATLLAAQADDAVLATARAQRFGRATSTSPVRSGATTEPCSPPTTSWCTSRD